MPAISVVVPVYNEVDSLDELLRQIHAACEPLEVIFVDDGSNDGSWIKIQTLARLHSTVLGIRFRRNFGKSAALAAAIEQSSGDTIVTMDADLQDDPAEIPGLLSKLSEGWDCVSGWKRTRHDPWHKVYPSLIFNWMITKLTGVNLHDHNCGLKACRRVVFSEVHIYGEMHRFIPVMAAARGFKVCEIPVKHRPRTTGNSKYGFERFAKGFVDLLTVYFLTSFRHRPQHLLGTIGIGLFGLGSLLLFLLTILWCLTRLIGSHPIHLHERAIFYFAILGMLLGVQLLSIGFIAELITAIHRPSQQPFSIAEVTESSQSDDEQKYST